MSSQEFINISNASAAWSNGVYPALLETSMQSFANRPLRGPGFLIPTLERTFAASVCALSALQIEGMLQKHRSFTWKG